ncbi:hypothetical protein [Albimonas pacifica]|uniref:Uncharacterized protein n=1 Tax=Albimonas pacifica TaxID=1114924 RepID=A0A1I3JLF5_9RHOB|nr:hypothetical protein [Albimonas pacifica]SFI61091.1 hypothetical protein SAMN05216258_10858 [Albimonas pacifica]
MSDQPYSLVIVAPAALVEALRDASEAAGHGRGFACALAVDGIGPATHYALRADAGPILLGQLDAGFGLDPLDAAQVAYSYHLRSSGPWGSDHLEAVLTPDGEDLLSPAMRALIPAGLQRIED